MKKYLPFLFLIVFAIPVGRPQTQPDIDGGEGTGMGYVAWDFNVPVASMKEYITETSWWGLYAEGRYFVKKWFSVGGGGGWNTYYEYIPRKTYEVENGAITGSQNRYIYTVPLRATAHFYPINGNIFTLYGGIGLGTIYMEEELIMTDISITRYDWEFSMAPEVGLMLRFGNSPVGALANLKYNFSTYSGGMEENMHNYSSLGFSFGIYYKPRPGID